MIISAKNMETMNLIWFVKFSGFFFINYYYFIFARIYCAPVYYSGRLMRVCPSMNEGMNQANLLMWNYGLIWLSTDCVKFAEIVR